MKKADEIKKERNYSAASIDLILFQPLCSDQFLNLDYQSFDQSPNSGWARLVQKGRFAEARNQIDRYLKKYKDLDP